MIQISPHLIRSSQRRASFDEAELKQKGLSAIERMMSSSPDKLDDNPLAELEQKIQEEKNELERQRGKSESIPVAGPETPGAAVEDISIAGDESEKPEGKTKTIKFKGKGGIPSSAPAPSVFTKEAVEKKKSDIIPFSLITKGLLDSGRLNAPRGGGGNKSPRAPQQSIIKVYTEVGRPSTKLAINAVCKVLDVIEMVIEKHNAENKESSLAPPATNYELRMLDDDDGSPDYDMAPLEYSRDIHQYGVAAVALVKKSGGDASERMKINIEGESGPQDEKSGRFFVRVFTEEKLSYVLKTTRDMTLREVVPLIAKKKQVALDEMRPELYNLVYMKTPEMEPLDMGLKFGALESDNLMLLRKVRSAGISPSLLEPIGAGGREAHQFMFTKDTAMVYSEYRVIKTNTRGKKQARIIGVDATNVYNKHPPSAKTKRRVSFDKVAHPFRPIQTVVECEVVKDDPQSFTIVFKDPLTGLLKTLQYQTETKMECAEIVAKVQFLRLNPIQKLPS